MSIYVGVSGKARKVSKIYVGVNGIARQVSKAYVGVSNKARQVFSGAKTVKKYSGTLSNLSIARYNLSATSVGDYALFGGGWYASNAQVGYVDTYNTSLTNGSAPVDLTPRELLTATTNGNNYAIFAGGLRNSSTYMNQVELYNTSLTKSTASNLSESKSQLASTFMNASNNNWTLITGGYSKGTKGVVYSTLDTYNSSLSKSTHTAISVARANLAATTLNNTRAIFAGGSGITTTTVYNTVDSYNTSFNRATVTLSGARYQLAATSIGDYALFGGGNTRIDGAQSIVDVFNSSMTRSLATSLTYDVICSSATSTENYAIFAGGSGSACVDTYDASLTKGVAPDLLQYRQRLVATTVGNYAIFAGGAGASNERVDTVDAYYEG